eukprot:g229.t1
MGVTVTHGRRTKCLCADGFEGNMCQLRSCPDDCSGHGTCRFDGPADKLGYTTGRCQCNEGFTGLNCGKTICPRTPDGLLCGGRGQCPYVDHFDHGKHQGGSKKMINKCKCRFPYAGKKCEKTNPHLLCNGRGIFVNTTGTPTGGKKSTTNDGTSKKEEEKGGRWKKNYRCLCFPGFQGENCEKTVPDLSKTICTRPECRNEQKDLTKTAPEDANGEKTKEQMKKNKLDNNDGENEQNDEEVTSSTNSDDENNPHEWAIGSLDCTIDADCGFPIYGVCSFSEKAGKKVCFCSPPAIGPHCAYIPIVEGNNNDEGVTDDDDTILLSSNNDENIISNHTTETITTPPTTQHQHKKKCTNEKHGILVRNITTLQEENVQNILVLSSESRVLHDDGTTVATAEEREDTTRTKAPIVCLCRKGWRGEDCDIRIKLTKEKNDKQRFIDDPCASMECGGIAGLGHCEIVSNKTMTPLSPPVPNNTKAKSNLSVATCKCYDKQLNHMKGCSRFLCEALPFYAEESTLPCFGNGVCDELIGVCKCNASSSPQSMYEFIGGDCSIRLSKESPKIEKQITKMKYKVTDIKITFQQCKESLQFQLNKHNKEMKEEIQQSKPTLLTDFLLQACLKRLEYRTGLLHAFMKNNRKVVPNLRDSERQLKLFRQEAYRELEAQRISTPQRMTALSALEKLDTPDGEQKLVSSTKKNNALRILRNLGFNLGILIAV